MGAKVIGELCKNQEISTNEAQYLLSFCNNASPAFVLNYICFSTLKQNELKLPSLIILLGTPVFCSFFFRRLYKINTSEPITYKAVSINNSAKKHNILKVIDQSILYSFESLIKICGYVILFSILVLFFLRRNIFHSLSGKCCLASLEITNGISILSSLSNPLQYTAIIGMTAFGGFCSIFQTASVIADTDIKISNYIIEKLVTTMATSLIAYLYMILYH